MPKTRLNINRLIVQRIRRFDIVLENRKYRRGFPEMWKAISGKPYIVELGENRVSSRGHFLKIFAGMPSKLHDLWR